MFAGNPFDIQSAIQGAIEGALGIDDDSDDLETGLFGIALTPKARAKKAAKQLQKQLAQLTRQQTRQTLRTMPLLNRLQTAQQQQAAVQAALSQQLQPGISTLQAALGGNPALVQLPGGEQVITQAGAVPQGKLFPLDYTTILGGAAGTPVPGALEVDAQRAFQPERLILDFALPAGGGLLLVTDIDVGTGRQVANLRPMSARVFDVGATFSRVNFDVIKSGVTVRIGFLWIPTLLDEDVIVSGAFYGQEL